MKCSICGLMIGKFSGSRGFGHNAQPINDGKCCDETAVAITCSGCVIEQLLKTYSDRSLLEGC